jgi:PAS domain S-box-containing protein
MPQTPTAHAKRSRFGIREKMLLVIGGVLAFTIALVAGLASYYTNRQNEAAAFADLGNDLLAWQGDLDASTAQTRKAALAIAGDEGVLEQLTELLAIEREADTPANQGPQIERTLAYTRAALLNRLYLMLRTGAFSSIAVYTAGRVSQYVSPAEAGMLVRWPPGAPVWVSTPLGPETNRPFEHWPSWEPARPPAGVSLPMPEVSLPTVLNSFPAADTAAVDVAVPLQAVIQHFPRRLVGRPTEHLLSSLSIGDGRKMPETNATDETGPVTLAVLVFRKLLGRATLRDLATKTDKWPVLLSLDGTHRQELTEFPLFSAELLRKVQSQESDRNLSSRVIRNTVNTAYGSFYLVLSRWWFDGQPRLVLGFALSRDKTLQNVRQTVVAILIVAAAILFASMAIGVYWVRRFTDPIVALTAAANAIVHTRVVERDGLVPEQLLPIDIRAPDEIGDLALAFNTMIAELRRSFVTLEQRVRARTEEVRLQTRYFRTLIDTIPLRVSLKDPQGRYLAANEPLAKACGLKSADGMIGKTDAEIRPDLASARFGSADDLHVMRTKTRETQVLQVDSDTGPVWIERFRAPVMDEDDRVLGLVRVTRDITVQKAAESAREMALAEAIRLARLRSEFLAQLSHELRTPLNAILGYAQILQQDRRLTERQGTRIAIIRESGEHLLNLINDILDLARIDAEKLDLAPTDEDLSQLVRSVAEIIRVKAREKGLTFHCESAPLPGTVRLDARRFRQVLLNLLSNAVKFTDRGEIALRVQPLPAPEYGTPEGAVAVRFEVQDSGIGMSAEQMSRLFQPFEQVGDVHRREGGAGLGLAISQQLVRLMGGRITVESQPGKGSLFGFELKLPVVTVTEAPTDGAAAGDEHPETYEGPRRSILVVDDLPVNRAVLTDMLTTAGFEIFEATNGQEAVAAVQRHKPDLVIMDTVMPVMDGLEATRRIRATAAFAQIPIFAVSANAAHEEAVRNYEAGVNVVLPKPIDMEQLLQAIGEHLSLRWVGQPIR